MNLKVAMIEPVGGHGGMDYYDFGLCGGLAAAGVDVVLHTCDETPIPVNAGFAVRLTYSNIFGKAAAWQRGLRFVSGSVRAVVSAVLERRQVIHLHFFHVGVLALMNVLLARLAWRKVVVTAHDVESCFCYLEITFIIRV
jgi:D-inositol-3-phosphate glycosyltransferase